MPARRSFELWREEDLYAILEVAPGASFAELKKAYWRRAKDCHPDRCPGAADKEQEFKALVNAFDILSDPAQRRRYDEYRLLAGELGPRGRPQFIESDDDAVMDSLADDILEELVLGNRLPPGASLQTLMRDLTRTERFIRFREARNLLAQRHYPRAFELLKAAVTDSPDNILYRYYLGQAARRLGRFLYAEWQFRRCLKLGRHRAPPQRLDRIRAELARLHRRHPGLVGGVLRLLTDEPPPSTASTEDQMQRECARATRRILRERRQRRRQLEDRERPRLGPGAEAEGPE